MCLYGGNHGTFNVIIGATPCEAAYGRIFVPYKTVPMAELNKNRYISKTKRKQTKGEES
jgi:hypothetical protein